VHHQSKRVLKLLHAPHCASCFVLQDLVGAYQGAQEESTQAERNSGHETRLAGPAASIQRTDGSSSGSHAHKPSLPSLNELEEYPQGAPLEITEVEEVEADVSMSRHVQLPEELTVQEAETRWQPRPVLSVSQREHEGVVLRRRGDPHTSILMRAEPTEPSKGRRGCFHALFFWGWRLVARSEHEALRDGEALELPAVRSIDEWVTVLNREFDRRRSAKSKALDEEAIEKAVVATVRHSTQGLSWFLLACWLVISMASIVLCMRELLVWIGDCPAFASMQMLNDCQAGTKSVKREVWEGAVLCASIFVAMMLQSLALNYYLHLCTLGVTGASSALMSLLYSHALRSVEYGTSVHVFVCPCVCV
jgi:hypothetical protein